MKPHKILAEEMPPQLFGGGGRVLRCKQETWNYVTCLLTKQQKMNFMMLMNLYFNIERTYQPIKMMISKG